LIPAHTYTHYLFLLDAPGAHRDLHSFPTRRSSDLFVTGHNSRACGNTAIFLNTTSKKRIPPASVILSGGRAIPQSGKGGRSRRRSEEHTSELQSQSNLVCRLLLEKKKTKTTRFQTD